MPAFTGMTEQFVTVEIIEISMEIERIIFFAVSAIVLMAALGVIFSRHPVRAVLLLVLTFFSSAILWLLAGAEFLAVTLVVVYIGAVMVLFLFVVMMLDVDSAARQEGFNRYLALGILIAGLIVIQIIMVVGLPSSGSVLALPRESNVNVLGKALYTQHIYAFELAGVILFVAIIAAISLSFRGRRAGTKAQNVAAQIAVNRKDRVRLIEGDL